MTHTNDKTEMDLLLQTVSPRKSYLSISKLAVDPNAETRLPVADNPTKSTKKIKIYCNSLILHDNHV